MILHEAVRINDIEKTSNLVSEGCDVNGQDGDGRTPLHEATSGGEFYFGDFYKITEFLLHNSANPNIKDNNGQTPLTQCMNKRLSELLREHGAKGEDISSMYTMNSEGSYLGNIIIDV